MKKESRISRIGDKLIMQVDSPSAPVSVVFEDDGDTGYFYALAPTPDGQLELLDALHIYNAEESLRGTDTRLEVVWADDNSRAGLRLNASLWAVFDFVQEAGWTRSDFPPPSGRWRMMGERPAWDDALLKQFS